MPLTAWLDDGVLLDLARENAVAETAFLVQKKSPGRLPPSLVHPRRGNGPLRPRHVGLRTYVVLTFLEPEAREVAFDSMSGTLVVTETETGYEMALPNRAPEPAILPAGNGRIAQHEPVEVHKSRDYMLVYRTQREVAQFSVNRHLFDRINLGTGGVIVTAPGTKWTLCPLFHASGDHPGRPRDRFGPLHLGALLG